MIGKSSQIRQQTLQLASDLARWCQVRGDLLYAFEKSVEGGLEQPLRSVVSDFITRVRGGMAIEQALDLLQKAVEDDSFQDLVLSMRFNFRHRGDLPVLLEHLEWQLSRIEEEYTRRKLSHDRDRKITAGILVMVPLIAIIKTSLDSTTAALLIQPGMGIVLTAIGIMAYLLSVLSFFFIRKKINL
jgi:hypothetical protein